MDRGQNFAKVRCTRCTALLSPQKSSYFLLFFPMTYGNLAGTIVFSTYNIGWCHFPSPHDHQQSPSEASSFSLADLKNCLPLCRGERETKRAIDHEDNCTPAPHSGRSLRSISLQGVRGFTCPPSVWWTTPASPLSPEILQVATSSFPHSH